MFLKKSGGGRGGQNLSIWPYWLNMAAISCTRAKLILPTKSCREGRLND